MSFFDFLFCNGCRNAPKADITADIDIVSLEILSVSDNIISIFLDTQVSLNCTNSHPNDCLYVYSNPHKISLKLTHLPSQDFQSQHKIGLDYDGGYLISNKAELKIKPGIYNILYLRNNGYKDKEAKDCEWKVLGSSPAFKLDVMLEENNQKTRNNKERSLKSTEASEKTRKEQKSSNKKMESSTSFTKLKTELFDQQNLDETFLPLKPKKINLDCYFTNPTVSKYRSVKKKEKKNKENSDPNVFS